MHGIFCFDFSHIGGFKVDSYNFDLCMYNDNEHFFVHAYWLFLDLLQSDSYSVNLLI